MPSNLTLVDRLRIELRIWALDQRLYDLPHARRVATRREVRSNLTSAAQSIGLRGALANLGTTGQLAEEYLQAQFGSLPRPSWWSAAVFLFTALLVLTSVLTDAARAFGDGLLAASPDAEGAFSWPGVAHLQTSVRYTIRDGHVDFVGGAPSPLAYLLLVVGAIAVGRLWRLLPGRSAARRGRRAQLR